MSPTSLKLSDIFKEMTIAPELEDALIFKTDANQAERTMEITITDTKIIPYGVIEDFKAEVCQRYSLNKFVLRVKYVDVDINSIDTDLYYNNLIFYVNELIPGLRHIFTNSTAEFCDNLYKVHLKYGVEMLKGKNCEDMMKRLCFSQLGANVEFEFIDDSDDHQLEKMPKEKWDEYLEWLEDFEYVKLGIPKPDFVVYLDMPIDVSQKLMSLRSEKTGEKKDVHEADVEYLYRCREAAMYAAEKMGWTVITCAENGEPYSIAQIHKKIVEALPQEFIYA